ncbi:MAG: endolytic transglycosylase MltG [Pseudomonadota bacterium]
MFRIFLAGVMIVALIAVAVVGVSLYTAATQWHSPATVEVEIAPGSSVHRIAADLAQQNVIRTPALFVALARFRGIGGKLRAGTYEFEAGTTLMSAFKKVARGEVKQYPFTIIEGQTMEDTARTLERGPFAAGSNIAARFRFLARDPTFIAQLGFAGVNSLEGYLFPDTYLISKPVTAEALIKRLVARFREVWKTLDGAALKATGMKEKDIVTLASIIEKETGAANERPLIASVFMNRLKNKMPLQSDPTIIYGLPNFDGNLHKGDITNPHLYNTYVHPGLPPGPICNPGKASLNAALHPAQSDYLFFVSKNDGTHLFTATLAEHMQGVREYQIEGKGRQ